MKIRIQTRVRIIIRSRKRITVEINNHQVRRA